MLYYFNEESEEKMIVLCECFTGDSDFAMFEKFVIRPEGIEFSFK